MTLIKWDPFAGLSSMHSQIDDMFNNFFSTGMQRTMAPPMDVYTEDDNTLVAEVHCPGFDKDDIEVNVHNGVLEVKGEKHEKTEEKGDKKRDYMMRESHSSIYRSLVLPKTADADSVEAHFDQGMLKLRIKLKELPQPKKVAITAGEKKQ